MELESSLHQAAPSRSVVGAKAYAQLSSCTQQAAQGSTLKGKNDASEPEIVTLHVQSMTFLTLERLEEGVMGSDDYRLHTYDEVAVERNVEVTKKASNPDGTGLSHWEALQADRQERSRRRRERLVAISGLGVEAWLGVHWFCRGSAATQGNSHKETYP